jgi:hypothetical protein
MVHDEMGLICVDIADIYTAASIRTNPVFTRQFKGKTLRDAALKINVRPGYAVVFTIRSAGVSLSEISEFGKMLQYYFPRRIMFVIGLVFDSKQTEPIVTLVGS